MTTDTNSRVDADKLIEAMAAPLIDDIVVGCCTIDEHTAREVATAAYTAMRDAMVPVGWLARDGTDDGAPDCIETDAREIPPYATITPLYALPEIKP